MSDGSSYRLKVEKESQHFLNVSAFTTQEIVEKIVEDGIHILINLSGYTKGARNEVFAARPAPVQMSYMGFAGTLAAGWCDYFIVGEFESPLSFETALTDIFPRSYRLSSKPRLWESMASPQWIRWKRRPDSRIRLDDRL